MHDGAHSSHFDDRKCEPKEVGVRLRAFRESLGLSQPAFANAVGGTKPGIQDNEAGKSIPGGRLLQGMIAAGINTNWLLTGEGPMLLAELQPKRQSVPINVKALAAILAGLTEGMTGATHREIADEAVAFYLEQIARGTITPTGIGRMEDAA